MPSPIRRFLTSKASAKDNTLQLECFFCGEKRNIPKTAIETVALKPTNPLNRQTELWSPVRQDICKKWSCPVCESVNVRDEHGEVVDNFPEMRNPSLNRVAGAVRAKSNRTSRVTDSVFCETCQSNQQLVAKMLGEFVPDENDPEYELYIASIDSYRTDLETRYPLACASCQIKVDEELSRKEKTLWMTRLDQVLHRSRNAVRLPPGSHSKKEGVKPIIEPVPWWKQFGWAILGLIWVTTWVATIVINIQGIFTSPSKCDVTQSRLLQTISPDGDDYQSFFHAIFVLMRESANTTSRAASACLWEKNSTLTCTCALRNAFPVLMFLSVLSTWFNPTWRFRALRGSCKPVAGLNTYKKCQWQAVLFRFGIYVAIVPTFPDVLAKALHVALLAISLTNLYEAFTAIQIFETGQLGSIRPDGLRVTGKRTSGYREPSPKASQPDPHYHQTLSRAEPLNESLTQSEVLTAHPCARNDPELDLAHLSLGSTGVRGHSTSSRRHGGMNWSSSSYTPRGPQNRSVNPRSTEFHASFRSFPLERPFSHPRPTTSAVFGSANVGRLANSRPPPFESLTNKVVTGGHDEFTLDPQKFFPPEKPTGLEDLLTSFNIDDGSTLKRLQRSDNRQAKTARQIIIAATLVRIVTLIQGPFQYFYVGLITIALRLLKMHKGSLTRNPQQGQANIFHRHFNTTRILIFLLCVRLIIVTYTAIIAYMTWKSPLVTEDDYSNEVPFWQMELLQFPFLEHFETEIFIPLVGDLSGIAGFGLDMAICSYGIFCMG